MRPHQQLTLALPFLVAASCGPDTMEIGDDHQPAALTRAASPLTWVGDTHLRVDGRFVSSDLVLSGRDLEVYTQTHPQGAAQSVILGYRDPRTGSVESVPMVHDLAGAGARANNDQWRASIPAAALVAGARVEYWIAATSASGDTLWDSDGGANHAVTPADALSLDDADCWRMAGLGDVVRDGDVFRAQPDQGLGLLWCDVPLPADFALEVSWRTSQLHDNGGVVLRFRDPEPFGYDNAAWVGVHDGHEIQIDELGRPDGAPWHMTGAIYDEHDQSFTRRVPHGPGEWNRFVIEVVGQRYRVSLNGELVSELSWSGDARFPDRAQPGAWGAPRFFGIQAHSGNVEYKDIVVRAL